MKAHTGAVFEQLSSPRPIQTMSRINKEFGAFGSLSTSTPTDDNALAERHVKDIYFEDLQSHDLFLSEPNSFDGTEHAYILFNENGNLQKRFSSLTSDNSNHMAIVMNNNGNWMYLTYEANAESKWISFLPQQNDVLISKLNLNTKVPFVYEK